MAEPNTPQHPTNPLASLEEWEDDLLRRYPREQPATAAKKKEAFRNYQAEARPSVREFYRLNHRHQTLDFVRAKKREYLSLNRRTMGIWEAMEFLDTLVDDSDPDTDLTQIEHLLQTAEAVRRDGHPRWFILTGQVPSDNVTWWQVGQLIKNSWFFLIVWALIAAAGIIAQLRAPAIGPDTYELDQSSYRYS